MARVRYLVQNEFTIAKWNCQFQNTGARICRLENKSNFLSNLSDGNLDGGKCRKTKGEVKHAYTKSKNYQIHFDVASNQGWGRPEFHEKVAWRDQKTDLETTYDF